jgi:hypothetical protein
MSDRSSPRQADVADFPRQVVSAVIKMAIRDDARTEARSHGKEDHILCSLAGAKAVLRHGACVGVILHLALSPKFFLHNCLDWDVIPGWKIGGRLDNALDSIQRAAATHAYPLDGGYLEPLLSKQDANRFLGQLKSSIRAFRRKGGKFRSAQNSRRACRSNDCCLSSAHIYSYPNIFIHDVLRRQAA